MQLKFSQRQLYLYLILISVFLIIGSLAWSLWQTRAALASAKKLQLHQAAQQARNAKPVTSTLARIGGGLIPDLKAWDQLLTIVISAPTLADELLAANAAALSGTTNPSATSTFEQLSVLVKDIDLLQAELTESWVLKRWFAPEFEKLTKLNSQLNTVFTTLLTGRHTYVAMFQNTEELRATGGFMGSYSVIELDQAQLKNVQILDIYVPDGQFRGFVTPPAGVKEYLSSGNGLRLPDANWWPDFPSSATRILPFMGLGQNQAVDGVVAINLDLVEKMLQVTGPIYLPDYQISVTTENFALVARADRETFFPGSTAKVQFLSHFLTQLKLKLSSLSSTQQQELVQILISSFTSKDIQMYSNQPALQDLLRDYRVAGEIATVPESFYLMLVESNVGINKSNRQLTRQVELNLGETHSTISVNFENQNPDTSSANLKPIKDAAAHLHYINYQRLLVQPTTSVAAINFNGQSLTTWDEELITTNNGQQFKQIGFLIEVPEQTQRQLTLELTHPPLSTFSSLVIQKQAGLPSTVYELTTPNWSKSLLLEQDEVIQL